MRRVARETGHRRETIVRYGRAAGVLALPAVADDSKPATEPEVPTDSKPATGPKVSTDSRPAIGTEVRSDRDPYLRSRAVREASTIHRGRGRQRLHRRGDLSRPCREPHRLIDPSRAGRHTDLLHAQARIYRAAPVQGSDQHASANTFRKPRKFSQIFGFMDSERQRPCSPQVCPDSLGRRFPRSRSQVGYVPPALRLGGRVDRAAPLLAVRAQWKFELRRPETPCLCLYGSKPRPLPWIGVFRYSLPLRCPSDRQ
jgi:hypothetical protein